METSTQNQWKHPSNIVRKSIELWSGETSQIDGKPDRKSMGNSPNINGKSTQNRWKQSIIDGNAYRNR